MNNERNILLSPTMNSLVTDGVQKLWRLDVFLYRESNLMEYLSRYEWAGVSRWSHYKLSMALRYQIYDSLRIE